jgi:Transglycosylase
MKLLGLFQRGRAVRWAAAAGGGALIVAMTVVGVRGRLAAAVQTRLEEATGHRVLVATAALVPGGVAARNITVFGAPPFEAEPLAHIDRLEVRLGGRRGWFSPAAVRIDGLDLDYLRAGSIDNVANARPRVSGGDAAGAGVRITVASGRLRGTIQLHGGPRVLLRARGLSLDVTPAGERVFRLEGPAAEVAGWMTVSARELTGSSARDGSIVVRADSAALAVPGGGSLAHEVALRGIFAPHRTELTVTREPGQDGPRAGPGLRAALRIDGQGGQLAFDATQIALHPLHAWLDRLGLQVDDTRADLHLLASREAGRPEIRFEVDLRARGFGLQGPAIDRVGWLDLALEAHAAGALVVGARAGTPALVRIERAEIEALGARLIASGWTELGPTPRGSWSVRTPPGAPLDCGPLLAGQPAPVRDALAGLRLAGSLGLLASVTFDAAGWDGLSLELGLDPVCDVLAEPTVLAGLQRTLLAGAAPAGAPVALPLGRYHPDFAPLGSMPAHLIAAFLTAEDGRFFLHQGFDLEMIRRALAHDLEMRAFAKGGSTITQQLAKNLFLPRSRTLARKLEETVLAWRLQKLVPRKRMLELYLNVIELGPQIRGVKQAARAYFGKELAELRPIESAHLAALTPNPRGLARRFRDGRVDDGWMQRLYDLLGMMNRSGRLSRSDLTAARAGKLTLRKI